MNEAYPLSDLCLSEICRLFSSVQHLRVQTLIIEAYPLGDLCLGEIWICILGFVPRIHTEEIEGGLVGLGCIGVLGFVSMHLHRQTRCQHSSAQTDRHTVRICLHRQTDTQSACTCTDRHTVSMHPHRQTDTQSACTCTDRHTVSMHPHRQTDTQSACTCTDRHTVSMHPHKQTDTLSACICKDTQSAFTCSERQADTLSGPDASSGARRVVYIYQSAVSIQCHCCPHEGISKIIKYKGCMCVASIYMHTNNCLSGMQEFEHCCRNALFMV